MKELKEYIEDENFVELMNRAFTDLRADYELDLDYNFSKIEELTKIHVDVKGNLSNLVSASKNSSGLVTGLRGTGKTHLFLLAKHLLNSNLERDKTFCIYLNLKRLHLPDKFDNEIFTRVFFIFFYSELKKQLVQLLKSLSGESFFDKILLLFKSDKRFMVKSINKVLLKIFEFEHVITKGSQELVGYKEGELLNEISTKELIEIQNKLISKLGLSKSDFSQETFLKELNEITDKSSRKNVYTNYLNINDVRTNLIELVRLLNIDGITIYVDEWEKIYNTPNGQLFTSQIIDKLIDDPFYFWIGYVPFRGQLHALDNGGDLQHYIDLDKSLIFESSTQDRETCKNYFKNFINNRLNFFLSDYQLDYRILFNSDSKLELLIFGSMGNSRDFGTMLLKCWSEYKDYRTSELMQGRPYKFISDKMIVNAIKEDGEKKTLNIRHNEQLMQIWKDLEGFAINKKSSHFAIEDTKDNNEILSNSLFSELLYHRLLHFRKGHISPKEGDMTSKLAIYALNYACTYDLHSNNKSFSYVTDYSVIHDRVRRYVYNPSVILNDVKLKSGEIFPCISCKLSINIGIMKGAWEKNSCPFCGGIIYNK